MKKLGACLMALILLLVPSSAAASPQDGGAFYYSESFGGFVDSSCTLGGNLAYILFEDGPDQGAKVKICSNQSDFTYVNRFPTGNFNDKASHLRIVKWNNQTSLCKLRLFPHINYNSESWEWFRYTGDYDIVWNDWHSSAKFFNCTF